MIDNVRCQWLWGSNIYKCLLRKEIASWTKPDHSLFWALLEISTAFCCNLIELILFLQYTIIHYSYATLHACCSQSELTIVKVTEISARALFLFNCTPNNFHAREGRVGCIHVRVGLIHFYFSDDFILLVIFKTLYSKRLYLSHKKRLSRNCVIGNDTDTAINLV